MKIFENLRQMCTVHMHVHLGSGNALMPQHLLYGPKVGTIFQKMGSKGMPKGMGADIFVQPNFFCKSFNNGENVISLNNYKNSVQKLLNLEDTLPLIPEDA